MIEAVFPKSYLDGLFSSEDPRRSKSIIHLDAILHTMMNNMTNSRGPFTSDMVYDYCKDRLLPLLMDSSDDHHLSHALLSNHGIKAIAETMFRSAVRKGNAEIVRKLLSLPELGLDTSLNMGDLSSKEDYVPIMGDILPASIRSHWYTPLETAAERGHVAVVKILVNEFNADVHKILPDGVSSTSCECYGGFALLAALKCPNLDSEKRDIIKTILDAGAKLCARDLMMLILEHGADLYRLILERMPVSRPCCLDWLRDGALHQVAAKIEFADFTALVKSLDLTAQEIGATCQYGRTYQKIWDVIFHIPPLPPNVMDIFAQRGDFQAVKTLQGWNVPFTNNTMVAALRSRNPSIVRLLLREDAPLDCFSIHFRTTPLAESIRSRRHSLTDQILRGLPVRSLYTDERSYTACLAAAAESGNQVLTADLLTKMRWRREAVLGYALFAAVRANQTVIAISLLEAGAIPLPGRCTDVLGFPPIPLKGTGEPTESRQQYERRIVPDVPSLLQYVLRFRNAELFRALLEHHGVISEMIWRIIYHNADLEKHDCDCMTLAVGWGDYTVLQSLICAGYTATYGLLAAVQQSDDVLSERLVNDYAHTRSDVTEDLMAESLKLNKVSVVAALLESGYVVTMYPGSFDMLKAALHAPWEMLLLLLEGIRRNYNTESCTMLPILLRFAASQGRPEVVATLLRIFYDFKQLPARIVQCVFETLLFRVPFSWDSPDQFPRRNERFQPWEMGLIQFLMKSGADPQRTIQSLASLPSVDWTQSNVIISTPLLLAIEAEDLALIELLLDGGADVNKAARDGLRRTPLQMAAEVGSKTIVETLLAHGADVHAACSDRGGATPLQLAAFGGYVGLIDVFLKLGVDPRAPGAKAHGRNALEGAAEHGRFSVVKYLIDICPGYESTELKRAMNLAQSFGHQAIVSVLQAKLPGELLFEVEEEEMRVDQLLATLSLNPEIVQASDGPDVDYQELPDLAFQEPYMDHPRIEGFEYIMIDFDDPGEYLLDTQTGVMEPAGIIFDDPREAIAQAVAPLHVPGDSTSSTTSSDLKKQYLCHACNRAFSRNDTLRRHLNRHDKKRYPCHQCTNHFARQAILNRHLRKYHGIMASDI